MDITEILNGSVAWTEKGFPYRAEVTPTTVREKNWNVLRGDLPLPLLVLRASALDHNIAAMAAWAARNHFEIAPHGKTTMCPQIYARQIEAGAWAITVANTSQALVCLRFGFKRILIANQLVGHANIRSLVEAMKQDPHVEIYCLVDSVEGVCHLAAELERAGSPRPVDVLVEFGKTGWRTGSRTMESARAVRRAVGEHAGQLRFRGVEAFEGSSPNDEQAEEFLDAMVRGAQEFVAGADLPLIFSAGGSVYLGPVSRAFARLDRASWKPIIRSGCYVTHDHGAYAQRQQAIAGTPAAAGLPQFQAALELWSYVQSMPDPNLAILTFGKRDCAYDLALPTPIDIPEAKITAINDQHAFLAYSGDTKLAIGEKIRCGISHPCTAFDKWRVIPVVDDNYDVIDLYRTYF